MSPEKQSRPQTVQWLMPDCESYFLVGISTQVHPAHLGTSRHKLSLQGFYATVRCRLRHYTKLPWREIKTKNGLQALTKAKQRKKASAKSVRPARPLQLFSQRGLYNAWPPRLQPKMCCRPSKKQHNAKKQAASP